MVRRGIVVLVLLVASTASADHGLPTVMDRRWSVSLAYGASTVRARTDGADTDLMAALDLGVRFRARADLELGIALSGALMWERGYAAWVADVRYRFRAERPWNPFVFAGAGVATWGPEDGWQLLARVGLGIERRFQSWAFSTEVRLARIGADTSVPAGDIRSTLEHYGAWDASLSVGALYYWGRGRPARRRLVP